MSETTLRPSTVLSREEPSLAVSGTALILEPASINHPPTVTLSCLQTVLLKELQGLVCFDCCCSSRVPLLLFWLILRFRNMHTKRRKHGRFSPSIEKRTVVILSCCCFFFFCWFFGAGAEALCDPLLLWRERPAVHCQRERRRTGESLEPACMVCAP